MKKFTAAVIAVGLSLAGVSAVQAAEGCGFGFHLSANGHCIRNEAGYRPAPVAHVGVAIGVPGAHVVVGTPARACPYHFHLDRFGHCIRNL